MIWSTTLDSVSALATKATSSTRCRLRARRSASSSPATSFSTPQRAHPFCGCQTGPTQLLISSVGTGQDPSGRFRYNKESMRGCKEHDMVHVEVYLGEVTVRHGRCARSAFGRRDVSQGARSVGSRSTDPLSEKRVLVHDDYRFDR